MSNPFTLPKMAFLDEQGREIPDQEPIAVPAGFKVPESLQDQIRRLVRGALSDQAQSQGFETFEDAEDFEIDDDMWDPSSPYEEVFDPVLNRGITQDEFRRNENVYRERFLEAERKAYLEMDRSEALRGRRRPEAPSSPPAPPAEQSGPKAG